MFPSNIRVEFAAILHNVSQRLNKNPRLKIKPQNFQDMGPNRVHLVPWAVHEPVAPALNVMLRVFRILTSGYRVKRNFIKDLLKTPCSPKIGLRPPIPALADSVYFM